MAEQQKGSVPERQNTVYRLFNCDRKNPFACLIRKCLDTSITGKLLGMLVVSLLGFTLVTVQQTYTLHRIEKLTSSIQDENIPQYKVSQYILRSLNGFKISLLHLLHEESVTADSKNILANRQRLELLKSMMGALKNGGTLMDVAKASKKELDVISVSPVKDTEMINLVDKIVAEAASLEENFQLLVESLAQQTEEDIAEDHTYNVVDNLDELHDLVTGLAIIVNDRYNSNLAQTDKTINSSQLKSFLTSGVLAVVLAIGTALYILLIVVPLRDILEKITHIAKGEGELSEGIEVKTQDEVGQLAHQLNILVDNIFSLNTFKAIIEEEETTGEVNQRLGQLLQSRYGFTNLVIYESVGNKNNMAVAFASSLGDVCSPDILDDSNFCRAKRTAHEVSSVQYSEICKKFPHGDKYEHHCIPLIAGGRAVGVVQFLCNKNSSPEVFSRFEKRVKRASRYVKEATPVIEAKRFAAALQERTLKDPMTDLYNRRFLETYTNNLVASTLRREGRIGILMCDMDFFKEVNDNYGHETGDVVLIKTADVLRQCVRKSDMLIRYGGEEFLVLLNDVSGRDDIAELAEKVRAAMENTVIKIPDGTLKKTMSIGFSVFPDDSEGLWEAIKYADVALYKAKESGRNKVVGFEPDMWTEQTY